MSTSQPSSPQVTAARQLVGPSPSPSSTPIVPPPVQGATPHLRSVPPSNRPPSPDLPSPSRVQLGLGRTAAAGGKQNSRVASVTAGPSGSSPGDGDDECRFVGEHPAAQDEGGRSVGRLGSSVTSLWSRGDSPGVLGRRRQRGSLASMFSKRFRPLMPSGDHPGLGPWDHLPFAVRSSVAGQERRIFDVSRLLVSRVDMQLYQLLSEFRRQELRRVFPRAPEWWPRDWGRVPVTLPWEVSLRRAQLVAAEPDAPVWHEIYQLFLQQLAAGWDLEWAGADGHGQAHRLPNSLALGILDAGGFAFLAPESVSLSKFLSLHGIHSGRCPPQREARKRAWDAIRRRHDRAQPVGPAITPRRPEVALSSADDPLSLALQGSRLNDLATEIFSGELHLNLARPDILCAFSSAAAQVLMRIEKTRGKLADLLSSVLRDSDPDYFRLQLEQLAGSLPIVSTHVSHYFNQSLEEIRSLAGVVNRSVASLRRRE